MFSSPPSLLLPFPAAGLPREARVTEGASDPRIAAIGALSVATPGDAPASQAPGVPSHLDALRRLCCGVDKRLASLRKMPVATLCRVAASDVGAAEWLTQRETTTLDQED